MCFALMSPIVFYSGRWKWEQEQLGARLCYQPPWTPAPLLAQSHLSEQTRWIVLNPPLCQYPHLSLGGENGSQFQYSCSKNPMDRGDCRAIVQTVTESDATKHVCITPFPEFKFWNWIVMNRGRGSQVMLWTGVLRKSRVLLEEESSSRGMDIDMEVMWFLVSGLTSMNLISSAKNQGT